MIPKNDLIFSEDEGLPVRIVIEIKEAKCRSELSLMTLEIPS
jgi:hypothetical protein